MKIYQNLPIILLCCQLLSCFLVVVCSWPIPRVGLDGEVFKMSPPPLGMPQNYDTLKVIMKVNPLPISSFRIFFQVLWWVLSEDTSLSVRHFKDSFLREITMRWWFKCSTWRLQISPVSCCWGCHWSLRPVLLRLAWLHFPGFELSSSVMECHQVWCTLEWKENTQGCTVYWTNITNLSCLEQVGHQILAKSRVVHRQLTLSKKQLWSTNSKSPQGKVRHRQSPKSDTTSWYVYTSDKCQALQ